MSKLLCEPAALVASQTREAHELYEAVALLKIPFELTTVVVFAVVCIYVLGGRRSFCWLSVSSARWQWVEPRFNLCLLSIEFCQLHLLQTPNENVYPRRHPPVLPLDLCHLLAQVAYIICDQLWRKSWTHVYSGPAMTG